MRFVELDEGVEIGDGFFGRISHVPDERDFGMFAGGLKEDLVVSAVVDVEDKKRRLLFEDWHRLAFGLGWNLRVIHGGIRPSLER